MKNIKVKEQKPCILRVLFSRGNVTTVSIDQNAMQPQDIKSALQLLIYQRSGILISRFKVVSPNYQYSTNVNTNVNIQFIIY